MKSLTKKFRGERLQRARLYRGMTLTELAKITGINKQSLSLYENNKNGTNPGYEKVLAISNALQFPREYFWEEDGCKTATEVTYFRSLTSATKMSRTSQSIKLEYVAKIYEILSQYIDFPQLNLPEVDFTPNDDEFNDIAEGDMLEEIEDITTTLRKYWHLENEPVKDLQSIMEQNGIIVTGFNVADAKIDAFSQRTLLENGEIYFVAVSEGEHPKGRIRFDMAHELGHILLHPWSESLDLIEKDEFRRRERQANMFASAFLLPRDTFSKDVSAYPTDLEYYLYLKKKWGCSVQAMIMRSHSLHLISDNQYQYMMRQVSKRGWRMHEPGDAPYFLSENIFQSAIDLLMNMADMSARDIMKTFSLYGVTLYPDDLEQLLHLKEGTLHVKDQKANIIQLKIVSNNLKDT